jgi:flagellar protein FlgJ
MLSMLDRIPVIPAQTLNPISIERGHIGAPSQLREAAQEFETYFLSYLFKTMRETVPSGLFENKAGQMFYSFYDQELARRAAEAGGIGLAAMIERGLEPQASTTPALPLKFSPLPTDKGTDEGKSLGSQVQPF